MSKYLEFIHKVGRGEEVERLAEFINPKIKTKKGYEYFKKRRLNSALVNLELSQKGKYGSSKVS